LLVIDEVQGGIGRTGVWFAHQHEGIVPDLVSVAKGLGGGLPVGACIGVGDAAEALQKGDHGSTFGGNPVSCAAALAVIDVIEQDGLLKRVDELGSQWMSDLAGLAGDVLKGVRGRGLWIGLDLPGAAAAVEAAAREAGFLVNATGPDAIRIAPPLILGADEAASFTTALPEILAGVEVTR
jgi:acetylornithine aminotransferase